MGNDNETLLYRNSLSYTQNNTSNERGFSTDADTLHSRAREKYPHLLKGSRVGAEASSAGEEPDKIETVAYRATSNYFARVLNLPKNPNGKISVDKDTVLRQFDWKNERVADLTVDSIFDDVIRQVAAERSRRGQQSHRSNVKVHPELKASKFSADKVDYNFRLDQMVQSIRGPEFLKALRETSELITSSMDADEASEGSDFKISSPPEIASAPSGPTAGYELPSISAPKSPATTTASQATNAPSANSEEAQAAQEKITEALESGGDDLVSLSENDELMKHATEEQKSEMIDKLKEHSDKKGKCDSRPEGNKADRAIANVLQSAKDKAEFDNLMQEHGGQNLMHALEYDEAKQTLVQAAAAWGSDKFIDAKLKEKYSKEIAASKDLFINAPDQSSTIQPLAASSYASDPTATGMERIEGETNAYIEDQAYTNLSTRAQREMLLMNAERTSEDKEEVDNTEVIREVEDLRAKTLAQIEAGDEESYKEEWEAWKKGLEEIRKEHEISEDAFRHTVTSRYENFYLGTNVSFGEPDSEDKDERSNEEKYHSYTRDAADLEQLREKYGQAPTSSVNGLEASSSLGATGVAGQAAQEELHKLLQEYELVVEEEGFESRRAETLRQEIADLEESSSAYTEDLNKIGVELDTLYQAPPADTFWLKFTEVFLAVAELAMTLAAAAFLGPAGVALVSAGWAIYHATQKDWMAMAGSLAGGAVGGLGAASGAIAKSAAKGSQTGAALAHGIGSKAATSTTRAATTSASTTAATTGAKSASTFSQSVSNLVAKTGKAGQFMGLNPADDVPITTGKLINIGQTTFETSYAASQGDALGAVSSGLGLSQEGMGAIRLTRTLQNSATAGVTTAYAVQTGQKFADGNYAGAFDLIGGLSNLGNMTGSNKIPGLQAGIGGVNEGLPTIDYSRSGNPDTLPKPADPEKQPLLGESEEDTEALDTVEETKRTEAAEEAERIRQVIEAEHKRFTGRSSQVKVEQMLEDTLGADVAKNIDVYYNPKLPEGQALYTPDTDKKTGKLQLSYGPKNNEQNIQWHIEHLDTLLKYNDNAFIEGIVEPGKEVIPALSKPGAITQLEFDKHEKLIEKAQAVIGDDTGKYSADDKVMAQENLTIYQQEQTKLLQQISASTHPEQVANGRRYIAAGGIEDSLARYVSILNDNDVSIGEKIALLRTLLIEEIADLYKSKKLSQKMENTMTRCLNREQIIALLRHQYSLPYDSVDNIGKRLSNETLNELFGQDIRNLNAENIETIVGNPELSSSLKQLIVKQILVHQISVEELNSEQITGLLTASNLPHEQRKIIVGVLTKEKVIQGMSPENVANLYKSKELSQEMEGAVADSLDIKQVIALLIVDALTKEKVIQGMSPERVADHYKSKKLSHKIESSMTDLLDRKQIISLLIHEYSLPYDLVDNFGKRLSDEQLNELFGQGIQKMTAEDIEKIVHDPDISSSSKQLLVQQLLVKEVSIQQMTAEDIEKIVRNPMIPSSLKQLMVKEILVNQIAVQALNSEQITGLLTAKDLPREQRQIIVDGLIRTQLHALNVENIKSIVTSPDISSKIKRFIIESLSSEQITAIGTADTRKGSELTDWLFQDFSDEQIRGLSKEQIASIITHEPMHSRERTIGQDFTDFIFSKEYTHPRTQSFIQRLSEAQSQEIDKDTQVYMAERKLTLEKRKLAAVSIDDVEGYNAQILESGAYTEEQKVKFIHALDLRDVTELLASADLEEKTKALVVKHLDKDRKIEVLDYKDDNNIKKAAAAFLLQKQSNEQIEALIEDLIHATPGHDISEKTLGFVVQSLSNEQIKALLEFDYFGSQKAIQKVVLNNLSNRQLNDLFVTPWIRPKTSHLSYIVPYFEEKQLFNLFGAPEHEISESVKQKIILELEVRQAHSILASTDQVASLQAKRALLRGIYKNNMMNKFFANAHLPMHLKIAAFQVLDKELIIKIFEKDPNHALTLKEANKTILAQNLSNKQLNEFFADPEHEIAAATKEDVAKRLENSALAALFEAPNNVVSLQAKKSLIQAVPNEVRSYFLNAPDSVLFLDVKKSLIQMISGAQLGDVFDSASLPAAVKEFIFQGLSTEQLNDFFKAPNDVVSQQAKNTIIQLLIEARLGVDAAKGIEVSHDPELKGGQVRYTPDRGGDGKLVLSYGDEANRQNIQWHIDHLEALLKYNDNALIEGIVEEGTEVIPALSKPGAIT